MSDLPHLVLRPAELSARKRTAFHLEPDATARAAVAAELGIDAVKKLRFEGALMPMGKVDWRLEGDLGATVVQPCVVTLAPVTTRIDTDVTRIFLADFAYPEATETEMPEDDDSEPLPDVLDIGAILLESLALALPTYPRADGAEAGEAVFTEPGKDALKDEDMKPFAGLAGLRDALKKDD